MDLQRYLIELSQSRFALMLCLLLTTAVSASAQTNSSVVKYQWERGQQHEYEFKVDYEIDGDQRVLAGKAKYELHKKDVSKDLANSDLEEFEEGESTSTAFAVSADGYLLTCAHCIRGAKTISISIGEDKKRARVIEANYEQDLALIKVEAVNLPIVSLGKNTPVELAQDVRAIGYPLSDVLGSSVKIAKGSIAGFIDKGGSLPNLQLDVAVNFGNSGGPLVDDTGSVVGVVNAKLSGETIAKVGFAIPIKLACEMLDKNNVQYDSTERVQKLSGPELAKRVTPSVYFVHTNIGPGGESQLSNFRYSTSGTLSRPTNNGNSTETIASHLIIGTDGSILDLESEVNLPLLLGTVGQMPFERLPAYTTKSWSFSDLYSISLPKSATRRRRSDPFGHMDPFGGRDPFGHLPGFRNHRSHADLHRELMERMRGGGGFEEPETRLAPAKSTTHYKILKLNKTLVTISKQVSLATTNDTSEYASMKKSYKSELVFDTRLGMFIKQQAHGKLELRMGEEQTEIPFEWTYDRIDSTGRPAIAKRGSRNEKKRQRSTTAAEQPHRVLPETGLTNEQIDRLLNHESKSLNSSELLGYLNRLAKWKEAKKQKAEIEAMLIRLAGTEVSGVRKLAIDALLNWNPAAATPHIIEGFNSANRFSRRSWMIKLGRTGDPRAAVVLCEQLLVSGSRKYAQQALMELGPTGESAVNQTLHQNHDDTDAANACLEILSEHGTLESARIIRDLARQASWKLRSQGESTLRKILERQ